MTVNRVTLIGNLGRDPELRHTPTGMAVCTISVATTFKSREGDQTEWHKVIYFDKTAETIAEHFTKGKPIYVEGRIQSRKYEDRQGNERTAYEIVGEKFNFLPSGTRDQGSGQTKQPQQQYGPPATKNAYAQASGGSAKPVQQSVQDIEQMDDDIPF